MSQITPPIFVVTNGENLENLCELLLKRATEDPNFFITVDTEFSHYTSYFPKLALIQVGVPDANHVIERAYIIDYVKLKKKGMAPFLTILKSPRILKVFHAADQDCGALYHALGCLPKPLFDTQIAARFLEMGAYIGYDRLVQACLDLTVDKRCQKSHWLRRPLSKQQIVYAAYDVIYLVDVYKMLRKRLETTERIKWILSESAEFLNTQRYKSNISELWKEFVFTPQEWRRVFILKRIFEWRETIALRFDRARPLIARDALFFELSANPKLFEDGVKDLLIFSSQQMGNKGISELFWEQHNLFQIFQTFLQEVHTQLEAIQPEEIEALQQEIALTHGNDPVWLSSVAQIRKICNQCALQNKIIPNCLYTKKDISVFLEDGIKTGDPRQTSSRLSQGWREVFLRPYHKDLETLFKNARDILDELSKKAALKAKRRAVNEKNMLKNAKKREAKEKKKARRAAAEEAATTKAIRVQETSQKIAAERAAFQEVLQNVIALKDPTFEKTIQKAVEFEKDKLEKAEQKTALFRQKTLEKTTQKMKAFEKKTIEKAEQKIRNIQKMRREGAARKAETQKKMAFEAAEAKIADFERTEREKAIQRAAIYGKNLLEKALSTAAMKKQKKKE